MGQMERMKADTRITAYQAAARIYCQKIGAHPDEEIQVPHPQLAGVSMQVPLWYQIAERMFDLVLLLRSMSEANAAAQAANDGLAKVGPAEAPGA